MRHVTEYPKARSPTASRDLMVRPVTALREACRAASPGRSSAAIVVDQEWYAPAPSDDHAQIALVVGRTIRRRNR